MEKLSYLQQYFICVVNEKGNIPIINGVNVAACTAMGAITELVSRGYVAWEEENRLSVVKPFDDSLTYLKPVYETIAFFKSEDALRTVDMYASKTHLPSSFREWTIDELLSSIGNSLAAAGYASEIPTELFSKEIKYAPKPGMVREVIENIRMEFFKSNRITDATLCLVALLDKSDFIPKYFSEDETVLLKERLKEEREDTTHAPVEKILEYIDDVTRIMSDIYWA